MVIQEMIQLRGSNRKCVCVFFFFVFFFTVTLCPVIFYALHKIHYDLSVLICHSALSVRNLVLLSSTSVFLLSLHMGFFFFFLDRLTSNFLPCPLKCPHKQKQAVWVG